MEYRRKRDFTRTREPAGSGGRRRAGTLVFVIQKHHASSLHFDLRLELDGVMKSWAVPKGPSRDPSVKRLAMQVEDHPIAYNAFEGTIPKGEYGGGTVMIWDRGTYTSPDADEDAIREALERGTLKFTLEGERLSGTWTLVKLRGRERGRGREWLLIKHADEFVVTDDTLASEDVASVVSGRRMDEITAGSEPVSLPAGPDMPARPSRNGRRASSKTSGESKAPTILPMLATAAREVPTDKGWIFEPKYDGVRVLAFVDGAAVALVSRNGYDKAAQFPEVVNALRALARRHRRPFVLDGEIVSRHGKSFGRFQTLQQRIGQTNASLVAAHADTTPVALVVFDFLMDGAESLVHQAWRTRRERLAALLSADLEPGLALGSVLRGSGKHLLERARRSGWEGIMAKRADAPYAAGERSTVWRKLKVEGQQELVVGGWTEPRGSRRHLGALLVGYWAGEEFVYAGRVGGGLTHEGLEELIDRLRRLERKRSPFADPPRREAGVTHWTTPKLVVEVKFNEWTADGRLRQPVFLGVRDDKDPRAVGREPSPVLASPPVKPPTVVDALSAIEREGGNGRADIPGAEPLAVTNLAKVYFPEARRTKGDLMRYYARAAPVILPLIDGRPLVLKRYPNGVETRPFFQQNAPDDAPSSLRIETVPSESTPGRRIVGGDLFTLLYWVQLGAIDVNPWHSRVGSLDFPDYTILDLDPGPKATFRSVVAVARAIKTLLDGAGLTAAVKTSGSRGLHIVIPLPPRTNEDAARLVAEIIATRVAAEIPKEATVVRSRAARPGGTVYVDYLQNIVGKSVASAFSVRPRAAATVSTPLDWAEVTARLRPDRFTMDVVPDEMDERAKLWREAMAARNDLTVLHGEAG
jgi:bifunctional non-homologous end joining protein LigD